MNYITDKFTLKRVISCFDQTVIMNILKYQSSPEFQYALRRECAHIAAIIDEKSTTSLSSLPIRYQIEEAFSKYHFLAITNYLGFFLGIQARPRTAQQTI